MKPARSAQVTACLPSRSQTASTDRKSTRLNSSHTVIYTLSLHDALPISDSVVEVGEQQGVDDEAGPVGAGHRVLAEPLADGQHRSEEHTSELQSHRDLHSFPTRRSSDLGQRR